MAVAHSYVVMNGVIQGSPSKEHWEPGDPLPWTTQICQGITCNIVIDYKRCMKIKEFVTRPDDTFIVTYPKSGTTWMQQIVKCLKTKCNPEEMDEHLEDLFPWFEAFPQEDMEKRPSPRTYKSHSPYCMSAKGKSAEMQCKYIHIMRHPKDVCVSLYHHMKGFWDYEYNGEFSEFVDLFLHGKVDSGSWFEFERSWWLASQQERVLFVKYEDLKENPSEVVWKVADFLSLECTDAIVKKTVDESSFAKMKKNNNANMSWRQEEFHKTAQPFMRKGVVGDWKNHFTEEQSRLFDKVYVEKMAGSGLEAEYDLSW